MARPSHSIAAYVSPGTRAWICGNEKSYLFGKAIYPPGGRCGPRLQSVFQLVVLIEGGLRVTIDGVTHDVAPGESILLHPGAKDFFRFSPNAQSVHTWCQVSPGLLSPADRRLIKRARAVCQAPSSIHLLIEEGLAVSNQGSAEFDDAMAALARACLLRFAALMLRYSFGENAAAAIKRAVEAVLADGHRTADLARPGDKPMGTVEIGRAIIGRLG